MTGPLTLLNFAVSDFGGYDLPAIIEPEKSRIGDAPRRTAGLPMQADASRRPRPLSTINVASSPQAWAPSIERQRSAIQHHH